MSRAEITKRFVRCKQSCCNGVTRHEKDIHPLGGGVTCLAFACVNCGHVVITRGTLMWENDETPGRFMTEAEIRRYRAEQAR